MGRAPNTTAPDAATTGPAASALIDQRIAHLGDWRGQALAQVRQLIHEAAPGVVEEWKWRGTPVAQHASALRWVRPVELYGLAMPPGDKPLIGLLEALV